MDEKTLTANCSRSLAQKGYLPAVACQHFADGKYSSAVDKCLQYLDREPASVSARVIMARSLFHAGEYDRARDQFQKVLKFDATNLMALKYLGDIMFRDGKEAAAMAYYRRVMELDRYCTGLHCSVEPVEEIQTRRVTLRRPGETTVARRKQPVQEPAFITETTGDIYREQGYFHLAGEVYRRLLVGGDNSRIATKLREMEQKTAAKDRKHESSH